MAMTAERGMILAASAASLSQMSVSNAAKIKQLENLVSQCQVDRATYCDPGLVNSLTSLILNTLIPQIENQQESDKEQMHVKLADWPVRPVEIGYTVYSYSSAWNETMTCRLEEESLQATFDECEADLDQLNQEKHLACNSSSLMEDDDARTSFNCKRGTEDVDRPTYLKGVIKKLSVASQQLLEVRNCDNITQQYEEKAESCNNDYKALGNKSEWCAQYQTQLEYYSCIHWVWQEEYFAQCDETRHAYTRDLWYMKQRTNQTKSQLDNLWSMLCSLNSSHCGTTYNGSFDANFTSVEAPVCEMVTEEHPCTETWDHVMQTNFGKYDPCQECWGTETHAPTQSPTPPTPSPTEFPTESPTIATCDLFQDPDVAPQARVNFLLKSQRADDTVKDIAEEFIRQWHLKQQ
jgi:hypothetical protein